jgi:hypothetical protein
MLGYQRTNEVGNFSEFGLNLISNNLCELAWNFLLDQNFIYEIWHTKKQRKFVLTWKRRPGLCVNLDKKSLGERPMYHNCASLGSLCKVIEGQTQFSNHLCSLITRIKTNMLLITFLSLIAKLTLVYGNCDFGTPDIKILFLLG